jgi:transposase
VFDTANTSRDVYADRGYPSAEREAWLKENGFQIIEGTINAEHFIEFLAHLLQDATTKIFLIVDNLRVHHAKIVRAWAEPFQDKIELFYLLPPYAAPESNPDEYLNHDFKRSLCSDPASQDDDLMQKAMRIMKRIAQIAGRV